MFMFWTIIVMFVFPAITMMFMFWTIIVMFVFPAITMMFMFWTIIVMFVLPTITITTHFLIPPLQTRVVLFYVLIRKMLVCLTYLIFSFFYLILYIKVENLGKNGLFAVVKLKT
ncbi:hypothetical protein, partial [Bacillus sp. XF8]|uniref:hypothetical protein n=1 Tax=Bacillus sp. XF8 TaxID=2819289 RepID=UPI001AA0AABD